MLGIILCPCLSRSPFYIAGVTVEHTATMTLSIIGALQNNVSCLYPCQARLRSS